MTHLNRFQFINFEDKIYGLKLVIEFGNKFI